jgi:hypothetical protein
LDNDKQGDGAIPPFQLRPDPHLVEGARVVQQMQELSSCMLDMTRAQHAMVEALGRQPGFDVARFQVNFMAAAERLWKTGDTPPIVQALLERLEAGAKQRKP